MSINYPTNLDTFTDPNGNDFLNSPDHASSHTDVHSAIEALETKVGADSSAVSTSVDYFLNNASGTFESHNHSNNGAEIVEAGIADDAVTNTKIKDSAVTLSKIDINSGARAYLDTAQSNLTHDKYIKVDLDAETYDRGGEFADGKYTATVAGYYDLKGNILYINPVANSSYYIAFYKNGAIYSQHTAQNGDDTAYCGASLSDTIYLDVGDYVELYAYSRTAGDEDTVDLVTGSANTFLVVEFRSK